MTATLPFVLLQKLMAKAGPQVRVEKQLRDQSLAEQKKHIESLRREEESERQQRQVSWEGGAGDLGQWGRQGWAQGAAHTPEPPGVTVTVLAASCVNALCRAGPELLGNSG